MAADQGTGVDAVHVWAFPASGAAPFFVGVATYGLARPAVAAALGNAAFTNSGYALALPGFAPGRYYLAVCAHRVGVGEFDMVKLVEIDVPGPSVPPGR